MSNFPEKTTQELEGIANTAASGAGVVVLHFVLRGTPSRPLLEITLDAERPIEISDCESVSKQILQALESSSVKEANYRLNVLSPGVDEPLVHDYQLKRSIGKLVKIEYSLEDKSLKQIEGILEEFTISIIQVKIQQKASKSKKPGKSDDVISVERLQIKSIRQIASF